jgi:glycine/serine hydroxymethyltransferase
MVKIAKWINEAIEEVKHYQLPETKEERIAFMKTFRVEIVKNKKLLAIAKQVSALCKNYPIY